MTNSTDAIRSLKPEIRNHAVALSLLAVLTLAMFADVLFTTQSVVLSSRDADLFHQWKTRN